MFLVDAGQTCQNLRPSQSSNYRLIVMYTVQGGRRIALLIEDKIRAVFQPRQDLTAMTLWVLTQGFEKIASFGLNREILKLGRDKLILREELHVREAKIHFDRVGAASSGKSGPRERDRDYARPRTASERPGER